MADGAEPEACIQRVTACCFRQPEPLVARSVDLFRPSRATEKGALLVDVRFCT